MAVVITILTVVADTVPRTGAVAAPPGPGQPAAPARVSARAGSLQPQPAGRGALLRPSSPPRRFFPARSSVPAPAGGGGGGGPASCHRPARRGAEQAGAGAGAWPAHLGATWAELRRASAAPAGRIPAGAGGPGDRAPLPALYSHPGAALRPGDPSPAPRWQLCLRSRSHSSRARKSLPPSPVGVPQHSAQGKGATCTRRPAAKAATQVCASLPGMRAKGSGPCA